MALNDIDVPDSRPRTKPAAANPAGAIKPDDPAKRSTRSRTPQPRTIESLDAALASRQKPIGPRLQADLWALVSERAEQLGVPIRLVLADALVRALEQPTSEHLTHVRETDRRERIAAANLPRN